MSVDDGHEILEVPFSRGNLGGKKRHIILGRFDQFVLFLKGAICCNFYRGRQTGMVTQFKFYNLVFSFHMLIDG